MDDMKNNLSYKELSYLKAQRIRKLSDEAKAIADEKAKLK